MGRYTGPDKTTTTTKCHKRQVVYGANSSPVNNFLVKREVTLPVVVKGISGAKAAALGRRHAQAIQRLGIKTISEPRAVG